MTAKTVPKIIIAGTSNLTWRPSQDPLSTVDLMCKSIEAAANDAGSKELIDIADQIFIPKGTWVTEDPGHFISTHFGIQAKSVLFDIGILQSSLVKRAIQDVAESRSKCTIIVGAETKEQEKRLGNLFPADINQNLVSSTSSIEWIRPEDLIISKHEINTGLIRAVDQYALIENASAHKNGLTRHQQINLINTEWEKMATIADSAISPWRENATKYLKENGWGRPIAAPYRANHITQWNVNQAAAIIITSEETAKAHGSTSDQWVYPEAIIESNHVTPVVERKDLATCQGMSAINEELIASTGKPASSRANVELYSCFPVAVRLQAENLGLSNRNLSITGGMTFAGGPFNNFTIQGISGLAKKVREHGTEGLITSVSGMLTKQGLLTITAKQESNNLIFEDVSQLVKQKTKTLPSNSEIFGQMPVISSTVAHMGGDTKVFAIVEFKERYRRIVTSKKPEVIEIFTKESQIGEKIQVSKNGTFEMEAF